MVKACSAEFFLAKDIKHPKDLEQALHFHAATPTDQIRSFRAQQAARLVSLSRMAEPEQDAWDSLIPPFSATPKGVSGPPF